ncbi:septation protein IspZ [Pseudoalteromonas fenneropenaei]|uniref:Septation protein IspZ n=1 Tax=Pseudoalteromonas fenneropenaei TaxID=1737459 RepID=A0ABV7CES8_9GAMM
MRIWTYERPFNYKGEEYKVKFSYSLHGYTSQLFCNGNLLDEYQQSLKNQLKIIEHTFQPANQTEPVTVSVGYYSWWNVGIEVTENNQLIYASHPQEDIRFAVNRLQKLLPDALSEKAQQKQQQQSQQWQKNKYSLFADILLGIAFFIVAKVTGDLTIAALSGVVLGLALVVLQRFVKVDLLGGLAVFGTIMLLISGIFSLLFQSEYLVQLKGTILGIISASIFLSDGIFRQGRYFGPRFTRYLSAPVAHQYFVIGMGLIGVWMAGANYLAATYLSEDAWLTYDTFFDMPISLLLFFILLWKAGKKVTDSPNELSDNVSR